MKVFNLRCDASHDFEGWFASAEEFESQLGRHLVRCPVCDSAKIGKMLSAPRINLGVPESGAQGGGTAGAAPQTNVDLQAAWLRAMRAVVEKTEDVGEHFAEEARKIHYREAPERGIRGVATEEERTELLDEGIEVYPLRIPGLGKGPVQ